MLMFNRWLPSEFGVVDVVITEWRFSRVRPLRIRIRHVSQLGAGVRATPPLNAGKACVKYSAKRSIPTRQDSSVVG